MAPINRAELRQIWIDAGGRFYGPRVEHATIEEGKFYPFLEALMQETIRRDRAAEREADIAALKAGV